MLGACAVTNVVESKILLYYGALKCPDSVFLLPGFEGTFKSFNISFDF